jgi:hypothetical protein
MIFSVEDKLITKERTFQQTAEVTPLAITDAFQNEEIVNFREPIAPEPTDSTVTISESDEKVREALDTERTSKLSKILAITGIALAFFLGPLGLIASIISWVLYGKAKRARYNTELGEKHLADARIAVIISKALYALMFLALIAVIIIFVLL